MYIGKKNSAVVQNISAISDQANVQTSMLYVPGFRVFRQGCTFNGATSPSTVAPPMFRQNENCVDYLRDQFSSSLQYSLTSIMVRRQLFWTHIHEPLIDGGLKRSYAMQKLRYVYLTVRGVLIRQMIWPSASQVRTEAQTPDRQLCTLRKRQSVM